MLYIVLLLVISVLPVVLLGTFIYCKDKNKEPIGLIIKLLLGGLASIVITLFVSAIMSVIPIFSADVEELDLISLAIYVFIGVAIVEEGSKWLMAYLIGYKSKEYDEFYDMVEYAAFVALGFALFENILYVLSGGIVVGIMRAFLSVPGHMCWGVFMGYHLSLAKLGEVNKNDKVKNSNLLKSILYPTLFHGIYDYFCFCGYDIAAIAVLVFAVVIYVFAFKKIASSSKVAAKIPGTEKVQPVQAPVGQIPVQPQMNFDPNTGLPLNQPQKKFCTNCGQPVNGPFCSNCGNKVN